MKKKILMIGTGGTIASDKTEYGLAPELNTEDLLKFIPEAVGICEADCIQAYSLDSTNMRPSHWLGIAKIIKERDMEIMTALLFVTVLTLWHTPPQPFPIS